MLEYLSIVYKLDTNKNPDLDFLEDFIASRYHSMKCATYRTFGLWNSHFITTHEPANIQAILATKFSEFELGSFRRDNFMPMLGNGIFTADGEEWRHYRAQLRPQFGRVLVGELEGAERHLGVLWEAVGRSGKGDGKEEGWVEVDLMPLVFRFTMDVSTEFLFGQSVESQIEAMGGGEKGEDQEGFADAMGYAQEYLAWRMRFGSFFWLVNGKKFQKACETVKSFADRFVRIALERKVGEKREGEKFVLLHALVEETRDPVELRDQVLQTLLAGRDTTSSMLCWAIILLSRSATEYAALRKAVLDTFGTLAAPREEMSFASLKACKRLTHVIYETLRLYPLVPLNSRTAVRDTLLPTGGGPKRDQPIAVMKDERVGYSTYVMQRRKDIWGDDAAEWKPERWEGRKLGWEFVAFSGGPRVCLGRTYHFLYIALPREGIDDGYPLTKV